MTPGGSPDAAAVARFDRDLRTALGGQLAPEDRVAVAVSGGPDSMALLLLAASALSGRVIAATVDHGLRAAAADEAAMVSRWCDGAGIPHATLTPATPIIGADVQAKARTARYDLLARWTASAGAACLVTAHHADDQAETFLMRAVRGAGPAGLAGIRRVRVLEGVRLVRPVLDWRRAELRALAEAAAMPFVDDPSNADAHYERTRVRALLHDTPWLDPAHLARAATHAAEADAAFGALTMVFAEMRSVDSPDKQVWLRGADLPRELQRRLVRHAIERVRSELKIVRPQFGSQSNIEPLLEALAAGRRATQAGVVASVVDDIWCFAEAPTRRSN